MEGRGCRKKRRKKRRKARGKIRGQLEERARVWREGRAKMKTRKNMNGGLEISFNQETPKKGCQSHVSLSYF